MLALFVKFNECQTFHYKVWCNNLQVLDMYYTCNSFDAVDYPAYMYVGVYLPFDMLLFGICSNLMFQC